MVKSRKKTDSLDTDVQYIIQNREQHRHHVEFPKSAIEVMNTHYTLNSAKHMLEK
jgi:hypothetical protein